MEGLHVVGEKRGWTWEENKILENGVAVLDHKSPDFPQNMASIVPGKTVADIERHLKVLMEDVEMIELGLIPLPDYRDPLQLRLKEAAFVPPNKPFHPRRKGVPWTREEHESFLVGLEKYGKGDWRSISRNCVLSKTPTQVASHAQKHFLRIQNSGAREDAADSGTRRRRISTSLSAATAASMGDSLFP